MRRSLTMLGIVLMTACTSACPVAQGLYSAVVHRSGAPPRAELRRVEARADSVAHSLDSLRLRVLPIAVIGATVRADSMAAAHLAAQLVRERLVAGASVGTRVALPFEPHSNELLIFWTRFRNLAELVRVDPPRDADVVLQVDVFGSPERGRIGAVHAMMVTSAGEMAYSGFWNGHQPLYREIRPARLEDALRMVALDLRRKHRTEPSR